MDFLIELGEKHKYFLFKANGPRGPFHCPTTEPVLIEILLSAGVKTIY